MNPREEIECINKLIYQYVEKKRWYEKITLNVCKFGNEYKFSIGCGTISCYYSKYLSVCIIKGIFDTIYIGILNLLK